MQSKNLCHGAARHLREILLAYLQAAEVSAWPGCDALTVEDVLDSYPEAVAGNKVPDWQQLLRRHPELEAELHVWLAAKDRWPFAFRSAVSAARWRYSGGHRGPPPHH
jgi:hypothetical protein